MTKYYEVIQRTIEVGETGVKGLQHINVQMKNGDFESAVQLFNDVVQGIYEISVSFTLLENEMDLSSIREHTVSLFEEIEQVVAFFEKKDYGRVQSELESRLLPDYLVWHEEWLSVLRPYILL